MKKRRKPPSSPNLPRAIDEISSLAVLNFANALNASPELTKLYEAGKDWAHTLVTAAFLEEAHEPLWLIPHNSAAIMNTLVESWTEKREPACKAGCHFCCYMRVVATAPEILLIAREIIGTRSSEQLAALTGQLKKNVEKISGLSAMKHAEARLPCPLLDEKGQCSVYEARPLSCRKWASFDASQCEKSFQAPSAKAQVGISSNTYVLGSGLSVGLSEALAKRGLEGRFYELQSALLQALETPDIEARWLRGEPIFEGCILSEFERK